MAEANVSVGIQAYLRGKARGRTPLRLPVDNVRNMGTPKMSLAHRSDRLGTNSSIGSRDRACAPRCSPSLRLVCQANRWCTADRSWCPDDRCSSYGQAHPWAMSTVGHVSYEPVAAREDVTSREPSVQRLQFGLVSSHCAQMSMGTGTNGSSYTYLDFFGATRQAASCGASVLEAFALAKLLNETEAGPVRF